MIPKFLRTNVESDIKKLAPTTKKCSVETKLWKNSALGI